MLNTTSPFFSIIIPVYNARNFLARCIESCINQSFQDIEILVIDDCGADNSIGEIQQYVQADNRITIVRNFCNLGLFHARLQGFRIAKGTFCLSLDADDFLELDICKKLAAILYRDSNIDLLHFAFRTIPPLFFELKPLHSPHIGYLHQPEIQVFLNLSNTFQAIWGKAIKTAILQSIANEVFFIHPPLNSLEDGIFNLLLSLKIKRYYGTKEVGYFYQKNPYSMSRSISHLAFRKKCSDFKKILAILNTLEEKYHCNKSLIHQYRKKVLSACFLEARFFGSISLLRIICIADYKRKTSLQKFIFSSFPVFWISCAMSMTLFYRWQTLVRLFINIFSFGRIKL